MQDREMSAGGLTELPRDLPRTPNEVAAIDGLDTGHRGGPEPNAVTLETYRREIPEA